MIQRQCERSGAPFVVDDSDLAFYRKMSPTFDGELFPIPPPACCPEERLKRRLAFRNHIYLHVRPSSRSGKSIFSVYPEDAPFPVWGNDEWWMDDWDGLDFGVEPSLQTPFFQQFETLRNRVPHFSRPGVNLENSDYSANASDLKSCYLVFASSRATDCLYGESVWGSRDCIDCTETRESELCYDCTGCLNCYSVQSSQYSESCTDSYFLLNCRSCQNCFGCVNLRRQQYCVFNRQLTKHNYEAFLAAQPLRSFRGRTALAAQVRDFWLQHPRPHAVSRQTEECTGNFLVNARNVRDSYFIGDAENIRYSYLLYFGSRDCYDSTIPGIDAELVYESLMSGIRSRNLGWCYFCAEGCDSVFYSHLCVGCRDCFGCVGLRKKQYCLFNRQYSAAEYHRRTAEVVRLMQRTGEWGEFFPESMSSIPYNQSLAHRYFPLSPAEAAKEGRRWFTRDSEQRSSSAVPAAQLADELSDAEQPMTVLSAHSGKAFRVTAEELSRYRSLGVPLPRIAYDERMELRAADLGGVRLFQRRCPRSGEMMLTTFTPDSPWIVWDRDVYENEFS